MGGDLSSPDEATGDEVATGSASSSSGRWAWRAVAASGRWLAREARPREDALSDVRPDPDWRRVVDGRPALLGPRETIEVARTRAWRHRDPLRVETGWWAPWQAVGLGVWAAAVGVAWWQGRSHRRGPLAALHEPWDASG